MYVLFCKPLPFVITFNLLAIAAWSQSEDLAYKYYKEKKYSEAIAVLTQKIMDSPDESSYLNNRIICYRAVKEFQNALEDANRLIVLQPNSDSGYRWRSKIWVELGEYEKAAKGYSELIRLSPNDTKSLNSLAWLLAICPKNEIRDGKRAVELAKKACESKWRLDLCYDTLAAAYAETGQFDLAVKYQKKAIELLEGKRLQQEYKQRLTLYEAELPFRAKQQR